MSDHRRLPRGGGRGRPLPERTARYIALPGARDRHVHGIWDRRDKRWAQPPFAADEAAERIAVAANRAHAAGLAEAAGAARARGFRYSPTSIRDGDFLAWGIWDGCRQDWADRPCWTFDWAERIAALLNEVLAAGLAEALIAKVRPRGF